MPQVKHDSTVNPLSPPAAASISQQPSVNWEMMVDMNNSCCTHQHTRQEQKYRSSAFVWAFLLCCFASPLCICIPFCFDGMKTSTTYCRQCKRKLGSSEENSKPTTANIVLSVCLFVGLGLTGLAIYYYISIQSQSTYRSYYNP